MTFKCHSSTIQRLRLLRYRNKAIQPCYSANVPFIAAACETEKYLMRTPLSTKHAEISSYRCYNCEKCPARSKRLLPIWKKEAEQIKILTDRLLEGWERSPEWIEHNRLLVEQLAEEWTETLETVL